MKNRQENELKKFNCLYKELDDLYHEIALKNNLSDSAFSILYAIVELGDGCLQTDIAKYCSISKQTIHTSAKNLEKHGYLTFQSGRGRDMHLYLTEAGKKLTEEKILPVCELENSVFLEMSPNERSQLLHLTEKYMEIFRTKVTKIL
ncbi:MarR family transcriptional regulator [Faecalimonas umbilicata]|nr:MarR family transcriptional regulator [Faecalimonas umbilicata]